jgi:hypothetical protein
LKTLASILLAPSLFLPVVPGGTWLRRGALGANPLGKGGIEAFLVIGGSIDPPERISHPA